MNPSSSKKIVFNYTIEYPNSRNNESPLFKLNNSIKPFPSLSSKLRPNELPILTPKRATLQGNIRNDQKNNPLSSFGEHIESFGPLEEKKEPRRNINIK
jgi:hypothetical protein